MDSSTGINAQFFCCGLSVIIEVFVILLVNHSNTADLARLSQLTETSVGISHESNDRAISPSMSSSVRDTNACFNNWCVSNLNFGNAAIIFSITCTSTTMMRFRWSSTNL